MHCDQDRICAVDRGFHDSGFAMIRGKLEFWNRPKCCPSLAPRITGLMLGENLCLVKNCWEK